MSRRERLQSEQRVLLFGLVLLYICGVVMGLGIGLVVEHRLATMQLEQEMSDLHTGYLTCLADANRATPCELEYDGDGSSGTPADYGWYWQSATVPPQLNNEYNQGE